MMAVWMMAVWWWWWVCILGIVCQARNNSSSFDQAASSLVTFGENWRRSFAIELFCHWITRLIVLSHATPLRLCKAFLQHSGNSIANQYIFTHITLCYCDICYGLVKAICLSRAGIVLKRLYGSSCFFVVEVTPWLIPHCVGREFGISRNEGKWVIPSGTVSQTLFFSPRHSDHCKHCRLRPMAFASLSHWASTVVTVQEAQLSQRDCLMHYVSKFVLCFTRYGSYKGFKQQKWPSRALAMVPFDRPNTIS